MENCEEIEGKIRDIDLGLEAQQRKIEGNKLKIEENKENLNLGTLQAEIDSLKYQIKKLEEENYAKNLQIAGQRQLVETLQEKISRYKGTKEESQKKNEETQEIEKKLNEVSSKCKIIEAINEELKKKSQKDTEFWELEVDNIRKQLRKVEEENFSYKKSIGEYEMIDIKLKKELSEKEKILKSLEELIKDKKKLEEHLENSKKSVMELTEINEKSSEKDKIIEEKNKEIKEIFEQLWKTQQDLNTINELMKTSEKFLEDTKKSYHELYEKHKNLEDFCQKLENKNEGLLIEIKRLNSELEGKIREINILSAEIKRIREHELIVVKISIDPEKNIGKQQEILSNSSKNEILEQKIQILSLEQSLQNLNTKLEDSIQENLKLKQISESLESVLSEKTKKIEFLQMSYTESLKFIGNDLVSAKQSAQFLKKYNSELESQVKNNISQMESLENKLSKLMRENSSKDQKISRLEEDSKSYSDVLSIITSEKNNFEALNKQKDSKIKSLSAKLSFYENQLVEKNKEILNKENEIMNADRQIDMLKKKISSSTSRIKQIATEQIDSQKKKLENYENEIKMLKEMIKSVQSELKYKQQEILKIKKTSPKKKEAILENSPFSMAKYRQNVQEQEIKLPPEGFKETPYKKQQANNIFKAKSPFKISSKKDLQSDDVPIVLKHVVKGYLTSYVLCEKEKKELLKAFQDEDLGKRGILSKSIVFSKCEELLLDTNLLNMYGSEIDYKDLVEINYHNQLQQIHRDLDINFSQVLPGSISVSELKLIRQALRPLHRQIWDVIIERITADFPREVDLYVVKQILSQTTISL